MKRASSYRAQAMRGWALLRERQRPLDLSGANEHDQAASLHAARHGQTAACQDVDRMATFSPNRWGKRLRPNGEMTWGR